MTKEQGEALIKYVDESAAYLRTERLVSSNQHLLPEAAAAAMANAQASLDEALAAFRALLP